MFALKTLEKMAYLKGLMEGLDLNGDKKSTKVLTNMVGVLESLTVNVADLEESYIELQQQVDEIDEDLGELEEEIYGDGCDCGTGHHSPQEHDEDDVYYEVVCPSCDETICLDDELLEKGEIECPNCGENLEFDLD
ncbi:MAG: phage terminase large subunit family protein [Oscillospiraceae bacterium]|nr:phage terminase large subunit family protein [Oscillospiraceae bacterium]